MWLFKNCGCLQLQLVDLLDCCTHDIKEDLTQVIQHCHIGKIPDSNRIIKLLQHIKTVALEPYYEWVFIEKIIDDFSLQSEELSCQCLFELLKRSLNYGSPNVHESILRKISNSLNWTFVDKLTLIGFINKTTRSIVSKEFLQFS
jgi:hypothetical protein